MYYDLKSNLYILHLTNPLHLGIMGCKISDFDFDEKDSKHGENKARQTACGIWSCPPSEIALFADFRVKMIRRWRISFSSQREI